MCANVYTMPRGSQESMGSLQDNADSVGMRTSGDGKGED